MESWSIAQVCELLSNHGFDEEVVEVFQRNKVSGNVLQLLDDIYMKELGISALGDRKRLRLLTKAGPSQQQKSLDEVLCSQDAGEASFINETAASLVFIVL